MPTPPMIARLWAGAREANVDREGLYAIVAQVSGGNSITALTDPQYDKVIAALVRLDARPSRGDGLATAARRKKPSGRHRAENETALIRTPQRELIAKLRGEIGGRIAAEDEYFQGFCKKAISHTAPRTAAEAAKVIEALKKRRGWKPRTPAAGRQP